MARNFFEGGAPFLGMHTSLLLLILYPQRQKPWLGHSAEADNGIVDNRL